jgi:hypothetical protein
MAYNARSRNRDRVEELLILLLPSVSGSLGLTEDDGGLGVEGSCGLCHFSAFKSNPYSSFRGEQTFVEFDSIEIGTLDAS